MNIFQCRQQPARGDHVDCIEQPPSSSPASAAQQDPNGALDAFLTDVVGLSSEQIERLHSGAGKAALHAVLLRAPVDQAAIAHELQQPGGGLIGKLFRDAADLAMWGGVR